MDFLKYKLISFRGFLNNPCDTSLRLSSSVQDLSNIPWHSNIFCSSAWKIMLEQWEDLITVQVGYIWEKSIT